jgi:hypothetical protein
MVDGSRHAVGSRIKRRSVLGVTFRHLAAQKTKPEYYAGFLQADPTHHVFPSVRIANALFSSRNDFVQFFTGVVMPGCGRRIGDFSTFLFHNVSQLDGAMVTVLAETFQNGSATQSSSLRYRDEA